MRHFDKIQCSGKEEEKNLQQIKYNMYSTDISTFRIKEREKERYVLNLPICIHSSFSCHEKREEQRKKKKKKRNEKARFIDFHIL